MYFVEIFVTIKLYLTLGVNKALYVNFNYFYKAWLLL